MNYSALIETNLLVIGAALVLIAGHNPIVITLSFCSTVEEGS
jgi:hypothetical protein